MEHRIEFDVVVWPQVGQVPTQEGRGLKGEPIVVGCHVAIVPAHATIE
jgi:hypothetical protein